MNFKPPREILEKICSDSNNCRYDWEDVTHKIKDDFSMQSLFHLRRASSTIEKICNFYNVNERRLHPMWCNVIAEATQNCFDHNPKANQILVGLFLGDKGVCTGFYDGGKYFRNRKIKNQYEKKLPIKKFDRRTIETNNQAGVTIIIFKYSDSIYVDSAKGILYCIKQKENLIAPKGEVGNYFLKNKMKEFVIRLF